MENFIVNLFSDLYKRGYLHRLLWIVLLLLIFSILIRYLKKYIIGIMNKRNIKERYLLILYNILYYSLWIVAIIIIFKIVGLDNISFTLGTAITAAAGLILIKTVYKLIDNVIAGICLVSLDELQVGQEVRFKNIEGVIIKIGWRKSQIRDRKNNLYLVPNNILDDEILIISGE